MTLSEKIQILRSLEGNLRGLNRALTKSEVARLIQEELGESISQAYLSQLESGKRIHMTQRTRELLAKFFKVHPGYLVSDPAGFHTDLTTVQLREEALDDWLRSGAENFASEDAELSEALRTLADHEATRDLVVLAARLARQTDVLNVLEKCWEEVPCDDATSQEAVNDSGANET